MQRKKLVQSLALILATGGLAACGGGGGGGSTVSGTASTSVGTISGFGSIFVNGVEWDTGSATCYVDDAPATACDDNALGLGMVVRVAGTVNPDGLTGTASVVYYDDDIEGPIADLVLSATTATFTIFGVSVSVDAAGTLFDDGASFAGLANGQIVEVSGYTVGGQIVATRIEAKSGSEAQDFELKGTVTAYTPAGGSAGSLTLTLVNGAGFSAEVSPAAELDFAGDLVGQYAEVKLEETAPGAGTYVAIKIDAEDEKLVDDSALEGEDLHLSGVLAYDMVGGTYTINGVPVQFPDGYDPTPYLGLVIEVEGELQGGVLVVSEVEQEDGEIEIEGTPGLITGTVKEGTVEIGLGAAGSLTVVSTNATLIHQDGLALNLADLGGCAKLEAKAYPGDGGSLIATRIGCDDSLSEYALQGSIDGLDAGASTVTVLGITYAIDPGASFGDLADEAAFYAAASAGMQVSLVDTDLDGDADQVELEH